MLRINSHRIEVDNAASGYAKDIHDQKVRECIQRLLKCKSFIVITSDGNHLISESALFDSDDNDFLRAMADLGLTIVKNKNKSS